MEIENDNWKQENPVVSLAVCGNLESGSFCYQLNRKTYCRRIGAGTADPGRAAQPDRDWGDIRCANGFVWSTANRAWAVVGYGLKIKSR